MDAQVARQLDAGEVALVVARAYELLGLLGGARQQRGAEAGAFEQESYGGAERAGTDDGDAAGMLSRWTDGGTLSALAAEALARPVACRA